MQQNVADTITGERRAQRAIGFTEHLKFFDEDDDLTISIRETKEGLERLGFGRLVTLPAALAINFGVVGLGLFQGRLLHPNHLALPTTGKDIRHPDTHFVDEHGIFDEGRLDAVFATYGRTFRGEALTFTELSVMTAARVLDNATRRPGNLLFLPAGLTGALAEWGALFWAAATPRGKHPVLEKATVARFYTDPKFFEDVAQRIARKREQRGRTALGKLRNAIQDWVI